MTINTNSPLPTLKLNIQMAVGVDPDSLFTANTDKKIDDHTYVTEIRIGDEVRTVKISLNRSYPTLYLREKHPLDPKGQLKELFMSGEVENIEGNTILQEADVIFISDTNHLDEGQRKIRGAVATILSNDMRDHVFLCEGYDSNKIFFNERERRSAFPQNLNPRGNRNYYSGWDHTYKHKESLEKVRFLLNKDSLLRRESSDSIGLEDLTALTSSLTVLDEVFSEAHDRTVAAWEAIQTYRSSYPEARIFLLGGRRHFEETWLKKQLSENEIKYCIVTPKSTAEKSSEKIEDMAKYYSADQYGIFGNRV